MLTNSSPEDDFLQKLLSPETELERKLLAHPDIREGLMWGQPRHGHPEGEVYKHIREVLDNIDAIEVQALEREKLRLIAFIHDSFKYKEDGRRPRNWNLHHAVLARRFMNDFIDDQLTLNIIQWHDEAYYIWRDSMIRQDKERAEFRMKRLLEKLDHDTQLYYQFFYCDSKTGDKNPAPIVWVGENLPGIKKYPDNF